MRVAGVQSVRISVQQQGSSLQPRRVAREIRRWSAAHQRTSAQRTVTNELPPALPLALPAFFPSVRDVVKSQSCLREDVWRRIGQINGLALPSTSLGPCSCHATSPDWRGLSRTTETLIPPCTCTTRAIMVGENRGFGELFPPVLLAFPRRSIGMGVSHGKGQDDEKNHPRIPHGEVHSARSRNREEANIGRSAARNQSSLSPPRDRFRRSPSSQEIH